MFKPKRFDSFNPLIGWKLRIIRGLELDAFRIKLRRYSCCRVVLFCSPELYYNSIISIINTINITIT